MREEQVARASRALSAVLAGALAAMVGRWTYLRLVAGDLAPDVRLGRSIRILGPIDARIDAPRELVFDVIAAPYLGSVPGSLRGKIEVIERSDSMVLAAHRTRVHGDLVATTIETVRFERPGTIHFRLVRGPVPYVLERFELREDGEATSFHYEGELGADLWAVGRWWGDSVARRWEDAVGESVAEIKRASETRSGRCRSGPASGGQEGS